MPKSHRLVTPATPFAITSFAMPRLAATLLMIGIASMACNQVAACTNFLITCGASTDGSTMVTYSADSHELYGELYYRPAATYPSGTMMDIYEWDTGKFLGKIPQAARTYRVVGNMNEHQVVIGETTWGGRPELRDPEGLLDYGSLIYIALQRAKTARDVIRVMSELVAEHGYYSSGESFSIADPQEVWLMELIGKGPGQKGAVWVARKIPDGYVSAHANAARIRQFPLDQPDSTWYSPDVITFAREAGYFTGRDEEFSFADAYAPPEFGARRFCDGRVWCMYHRTAPSLNLSADWARGSDPAEPLPLWIRPDRKLSVQDVMGLMRDHFEGTEFDMTQDVGAGPYELPYRWRPLTWEVDGGEYLHERAVSTQQTGFSFVSQSRANLPDPIGGVLWFGVDDTYSTVYFPAYCGIDRIPEGYAVGNGTFHEYSATSAFWIFNQVANFSYLRYRDMIQDVQRVQRELEGKFLSDQAEIEHAALTLYEQSPRLAVEYLTDYSTSTADDVVARWQKLSHFLLYKYLDGNVKDELGKVTHPGYAPSWYQKVAAATDERLRVTPVREEQRRAEAAAAKNERLANELASSICLLLESRKIPLDDAARDRIAQSRDIAELKQWLITAATASRGEELFQAQTNAVLSH